MFQPPLFIARFVRGLIVSFSLFAGLAWAAPPDPVTFSWAIERGDAKKVREWLDEGLDVEFQGSRFGNGLMNAAWYGNVEIMALFVERGANPRRSNQNGEQALQLAAWNGHQEAVEWLLTHGATLNRDGHYWSALHYAAFNGHEALARYLLARGANVNALSPNGSTPLMMAAREGREELAKVLLESGADTQLKNDWGDTALAFAMRNGNDRLGKMIAPPEEFAVAAKAPKESFGPPRRSVAAPQDIEDLLRQIREAEGEGRSSEKLHKQLNDAVNAFRREAVAKKTQRQAGLKEMPKAIVITAKRGKPGKEKAEIVLSGKTVSLSAKQTRRLSTQARIADLMRQIRLAEADGRPANDLQRQLTEAIDSLK